MLHHTFFRQPVLTAFLKLSHFCINSADSLSLSLGSKGISCVIDNSTSTMGKNRNNGYIIGTLQRLKKSMTLHIIIYSIFLLDFLSIQKKSTGLPRSPEGNIYIQIINITWLYDTGKYIHGQRSKSVHGDVFVRPTVKGSKVKEAHHL